MHFNCVSFIFQDLPPAYDMLPMFYRPRQGEGLSFVQFSPPPAMSARVDLVDSALQHAREFWRRSAADARISGPFRDLCSQNMEAVLVAGRGPRLVG